LTQKLYQLAVLEETLQVKLKLGPKKDFLAVEIMKSKPALIQNSTAPSFVY